MSSKIKGQFRYIHTASISQQKTRLIKNNYILYIINNITITQIV